MNEQKFIEEMLLNMNEQNLTMRAVAGIYEID